nr:Ig-like domain-containing protein [Vicinamibacterales bacterium]
MTAHDGNRGGRSRVEVEEARRRRRGRARPRSALPCVLAILLAPVAAWAQSPSAVSVRITSPLGRMGEPGTVRIVGQVRAQSGRSVSAVRFWVDGALVGTVTAGPPYAVEWTDDNPFQRREILVEAEDTGGGIGRDRIVLEPYVITELAEITSVLVEAGVYEKNGRMVRGLTAPEFVLEEDGVRQKPD